MPRASRVSCQPPRQHSQELVQICGSEVALVSKRAARNQATSGPATRTSIKLLAMCSDRRAKATISLAEGSVSNPRLSTCQETSKVSTSRLRRPAKVSMAGGATESSMKRIRVERHGLVTRIKSKSTILKGRGGGGSSSSQKIHADLAASPRLT